MQEEVCIIEDFVPVHKAKKFRKQRSAMYRFVEFFDKSEEAFLREKQARTANFKQYCTSISN